MSPNGKRVAVIGGALLAAGAIVGVTVLVTGKADAAEGPKKLSTGEVATSKWTELEVGGTPPSMLTPGTLYYFIGGADPTETKQSIMAKLAALGWSVVELYMPGDTILDQSVPLQRADGTRIVRSDDHKTPIAGSPFSVNESNKKVTVGAFDAIAYWRGPPVPLNPIEIPIAWTQTAGA